MSEFDETAKSIRKRFGDATFHAASLDNQPDRISSGVFMLDFALLGGFPHNRISMVAGERHAGKSSLADMAVAQAQQKFPNQKAVYIDVEGCIAWYERILDTSTGFVYTAEQVYKRKLPISVCSFDSSTGQVVSKPITAWFDNGKKQVFRVATKNTAGDFTGNHKFLVYDGKGTHTWIRADELDVGMWVCRPKSVTWDWGVQSFGVGNARLIGYLVGDGHFSDNGVGFTNIDEDAIEEVRILCAALNVDLVKIDDRHFRIARTLEGEAYSKWNTNPIRDMLRKCGLYGKVGSEKFIPTEIMSGSKEEVFACLSGLYMTDGTVHKNRPTLELRTISLELAEQIRHLWSRIGIIARVTTVTARKDTHSLLYAVTINGVDQLRESFACLSLVGYKHNRLKQWSMCVQYFSGKKIGYYYPDYYTIPVQYRNSVADSYINGTGIYYEQIESIDNIGEVQTYDFTVQGTHNLVVNDIIVHNTHDTVWARKLGVDTDKLYIFRPETGEAAIDVADALVRTQETSLLVIDSIAALVPMKETESSVEDQTMGLQARLVGVMVRKMVAGLIAERNRGHYVTVVLLNQFRSKIGGYGDPRVLPGGRAVEFSTSVQLIVKNKETMGKDEYDVEGVSENEHSFDIKKNKLNAGPRSGEFRMRRIPHPSYNLKEGQIDEVSTMLAFAKKFSVYAGGGSRWTLDFWNVSKEFRGINDACVSLYDDPETYKLLRDFLIYKQAEHLGMPDYFLNRYLPKEFKIKQEPVRSVRTRTR